MKRKLTLMQAALGLAAVASAHTAGAADQGHRLQEDPFTVTAPTEDPTPILIEGIFSGRELHVCMPDGSTWKYLLPDVAPINGISRTFTVMVNRAFPKTATVFQPTAEGIHPYVGTAERFAVETAKSGKETL